MCQVQGLYNFEIVIQTVLMISIWKNYVYRYH